jgi:hypothetical protein
MASRLHSSLIVDGGYRMHDRFGRALITGLQGAQELLGDRDVLSRMGGMSQGRMV